MKKALLLIDVQEEFLGKRLDYVAPLCQIYLDHNGKDYDLIALTQWVHPQNEGTSTRLLSYPSAKLIDKVTYSALNDELRQYLDESNIEEIHIGGVDGELSVLATMFACIDAGYETKILERLVSSFHQFSWEAMRIAKSALGNDGVLRIGGGRVFL